MSIPRPPTSARRTHRRLWPLMFLPLAGLLAGYFIQRERLTEFLGIPWYDPVSVALLGLLAGCIAMVAIASTVLIQRIARKRFTIGAILITIAIIAVLLGWAKALLG